MDKVLSVIQTALPVFLALGLGMLCRSKGFLNRDGIDTLKKVVVNITLPFVLLNAFATAEYSLAALILPTVVFLLCCLILGFGKLVCKWFRIPGRLAPFLASGFEAGMLGYALFVLLFPEISVSHFALLDLGQTLFVFTLYKILLSGKADPKAIVKDMVTSPILWAVFAGVLIGASGLYRAMESWGVSNVFQSVTSFLSAPTGMIILLTVGYDLVLKDIPWKRTAGMIALRLSAMALFFGLLVFLNKTVLNGIVCMEAALLMAILPPPYVIPVFADEPSERVQISSALSALTLCTMLLFALLSVLTGI